MKKRILTRWTFVRTLYLVIGVGAIAQSVMSKQWFGVLFGGYFASMGLFAFGCAAGNCFGGTCATRLPSKSTATIQELEIEEVKSR
jgi:hypothetical protein